MFKNMFVEIRGTFSIPDRVFNKLAREAAHETALEWHKKFLWKHFQREAYREYPIYRHLFRTTKRPPRKPLVWRGRLRDKILRQRPVVTGPYWRTKLRMTYGRPGHMTGKWLKQAIFMRMKILKISYKDAERAVFASAGYTPRVRNAIVKALRAISPNEQAALEKIAVNKLRLKIMNHYKTTGRQQRRRIAG